MDLDLDLDLENDYLHLFEKWPDKALKIKHFSLDLLGIRSDEWCRKEISRWNKNGYQM